MSQAADIFKAIDTNGDGELDTLEMSTRLSDFGMSEEKINALFISMDTDGNGIIDALEWERGYEEYETSTRLPALEAEVLEAIAAARADPAQCADRIKHRLPLYSGNLYQAPSCKAATPPVKVTKEGLAAVEDAISYLKDKESIPGFGTQQQLGLRVAGEDHIVDVGSIGVASHVGSDGSGCWDRMRRYGAWEGSCGECLWYGRIGSWVSGFSMVDDLIVDDGVASRGHRLALFDPRFALAGVSIGNHKVYGHMMAIEFAGVWNPEQGAISARIRHGPPSISFEKGARAGEESTGWSLGKCRGCCRDIEGGSVVEAGGKKWHKNCFCCTQCGDNLAGVARKKEESERIFCQSCWVDVYAPTCYVCEGKIEGSVVRKGNTARHPDCKPPAVAPGKKSSSGGQHPRGRPGGGGGKPGGGSFGGAKKTLDTMGDLYGGL